MYEESEIRDLALDYFKKLYQSNEPVCMFTLRLTFPVLSMSDWDKATILISMSDVHNALFGMAPHKSPGVDGFLAFSYQKN